MKKTIDTDAKLQELARAAMLQGAGISDATMAQIRQAAEQHAERRKSRFVRWWGLWRHVVLTAGGAAAAVLLTISFTDWSGRREAAIETGTGQSIPFSALVFAALVDDEAAPVFENNQEWMVQYLLQIQERPGSFERAHALYAMGL